MRRTVQQERVAKGLCPTCGKEAAPYYLCADHRLTGKIERILRRVHAAGGVTREKRGVKAYWSMGDREAWDRLAWRPDPKDGDKRLRPRIRGVPVDVEATVIEIMRSLDRPCTTEEIVAAWGRLRTERQHATVAGDVAALIEAQRRREARNAKRLRISQSAPPPPSS